MCSPWQGLLLGQEAPSLGLGSVNFFVWRLSAHAHYCHEPEMLDAIHRGYQLLWPPLLVSPGPVNFEDIKSGRNMAFVVQGPVYVH